MEYTAFAFRQAEKSPIQLTFVAPSFEIDSWAKVPTRLSNKKTGFQRAAIPGHVKEITTFFKEDESKQNSSPTAILIGVEPTFQSIIQIKTLDGLDINPDEIGATPQLCKLIINYEPWDSSEFAESVDEEIDALYQASVTSAGQSDEEATVADLSEESDDHVTDEDEANEADAALDTDDESESIVEQTDREIESFFASLKPEELKRILVEKEYLNWAPAKKARLVEILKDDPKPCLIIDGQHRVKGTRKVGNIPFTVAFLPYASWGELSFQFIVNNSSAKKVDENLLFGIVGHSLTPEQLASTEGRLNRAGIKVSLIKAAMRVQLEQNPFSGMLKTNTPGERGFLDATAFQKKVIELWYGGRSKNGLEAKFKQFKATEKRQPRSMGDIFGPLCEGANNRDRAEFWQRELWFTYFKAFWDPIAKRYCTQLWPQNQDEWLPTDPHKLSQNSQAKTRQKLMRATVLGLLQVSVLQAWADFTWRGLDFDGKSWKDLDLTPEKFSKSIEKFINLIPEEFFTTLTYTGFDASKPLRDEMMECMLDLLDGHKKLPDVKNEHERFWA